MGFAARGRLWGTTLVSAIHWGLLAVAVWTIAWTGDRWWLPRHFVDSAWYAAAIVSLCPFLSVLGARLPGAKVWSLFVILPCLAVFGWPIAAAAWTSSRLQVETPLVLGFLLVLVMGTGNYLGTRLTGPVTLTTVAIAVSELTAVGWIRPFTPQALLLLRQAAICGFTTAAYWAWRITRPKPEPLYPDPLDPLWHSFLQTFGIVWSLRVVEAFNDRAVRERKPIRLSWDGFHAVSSEQAFLSDAARAALREWQQQTFCTFLKRFVDHDWIARRCRTNNS